MSCRDIIGWCSSETSKGMNIHRSKKHKLEQNACMRRDIMPEFSLEQLQWLKGQGWANPHVNSLLHGNSSRLPRQATGRSCIDATSRFVDCEASSSNQQILHNQEARSKAMSCTSSGSGSSLEPCYSQTHSDSPRHSRAGCSPQVSTNYPEMFNVMNSLKSNRNSCANSGLDRPLDSQTESCILTSSRNSRHLDRVSGVVREASACQGVPQRTMPTESHPEVIHNLNPEAGYHQHEKRRRNCMGEVASRSTSCEPPCSVEYIEIEEDGNCDLGSDCRGGHSNSFMRTSIAPERRMLKSLWPTCLTAESTEGSNSELGFCPTFLSALGNSVVIDYACHSSWGLVSRCSLCQEPICGLEHMEKHIKMHLHFSSHDCNSCRVPCSWFNDDRKHVICHSNRNNAQNLTSSRPRSRSFELSSIQMPTNDRSPRVLTLRTSSETSKSSPTLIVTSSSNLAPNVLPAASAGIPTLNLTTSTPTSTKTSAPFNTKSSQPTTTIVNANSLDTRRISPSATSPANPLPTENPKQLQARNPTPNSAVSLQTERFQQ